jgi:hypothetical protein
VTRKLTLLLVFLAASISAFANVGFCPPPATASACSTPGASGETIAVAGDTFGMFKLGAPGSDDPWYLLVSIPSDGSSTPTAPAITSSDFTSISAGADAGAFLPTTSGDIYAFAAPLDGAGVGNNSMNATNMFGAEEQAAFGSTPTSFEVFVYTISPGFAGETPYTFLSSPDLIAGTFLAATGNSADTSTPFTTTGLVTGTTGPTTTGPTTSGPGGSPASGPLVPEPSSIVLLGSALLAVTAGVRKKLIRS